MDKYKYSATDESLLTPFLHKFFVNPFLKILPRGIPANIITLISNSFVLFAFLVAYFNYINGTTRFYYLIPIFFFMYLVGDCADGMQARRTKTGSPLGEFFDHFLDSFVTGLLSAVFLLCFRVKSPIMIFLLYQFVYIGQIGTFWERLHLGVMRFFKVSTSEGVVLTSVISASYTFGFIQNLNASKVIFNLSIIELIILGGYIIAGITGFITIFHTKKYNFKLFLHIILSFAIGAVLVWGINASLLMHTLIISLYNVFFIASVLRATNDKSEISFPDFLVPITCILFFILPDFIFWIEIAQVVYLSIIILISFFKFFRIYKHCWYWKNPKQECIS